jgi:hypothetical protein
MHMPVQQESVSRNLRIAAGWERMFQKPWAEIWSTVDFQFNAEDAWSKRLYHAVNEWRPFVCTFCGKNLTWWELWFCPRALHDLEQIKVLRCFYHRNVTAPRPAYLPTYASAQGVT